MIAHENNGPAVARLIGIIGSGAIGQELVRTLGVVLSCRLAVLVRSTAEHMPAADLGAAQIVHTVEELIALRPDVVIEAASGEAFSALVPTLLEAGIDVVAASVGALGDAELLLEVTRACQACNARLIVPAGSIGGLDYLAAISLLPDARVVYTSRKPPAAWTSELAAMGRSGSIQEGETVLFEGSAHEAARLYPRNLNAGVSVALAAGIDRTIVRVVADPNIHANTHEIEASSSAGKAFLRFDNRPSASNPKTSAVTALSLAAAARRLFAAVMV